MPSLRLLVPALLAFALCAAPLPVSAESFSDAQRGDIRNHRPQLPDRAPEVLEER